MKLTLYKHNLKQREVCGTCHPISWQCFPQNIQSMFTHAETVVYSDGEHTKILKAPHRSTDSCKMRVRDIECPIKFIPVYDSPDEFALFVINNAAKNGFYKCSHDFSRMGITRITLER